MTKLLEEAVAQVRALSAGEQDRAAEVLLALVRGPYEYEFDDEQLAGIDHAMGQADTGKFASESRIKSISDRL